MGQYDGVYTSISMTSTFDSVSFNNEGIYLNYTRVEELYGDKYNLSPRKYICGAYMGSDATNGNISANDPASLSKW